LKKVLNRTDSAVGGGLGASFIGLSIVLVIFIIFLNTAEFSLFSYKKALISKAVDYSVCAAIQQINIDSSINGIAGGFDDSSGKKLTDNIRIDMDRAQSTFLNMLCMNCSIDTTDISDKLLICTTYSQDGKLYYSIRVNNGEKSDNSSGAVENSVDLEGKLNTSIGEYWPLEEKGKNVVFINGNSKTNPVENGTYLLVFIKGLKVKGLFTERKVDFVGLAGAKISR
jgi:hypothetical protein